MRPCPGARTYPGTPRHRANYGGSGDSVKRSASVCCRTPGVGTHLRRHAAPGAPVPRTGLARDLASPARAGRGSGGRVLVEEGRRAPGPHRRELGGKPEDASQEDTHDRPGQIVIPGRACPCTSPASCSCAASVARRSASSARALVPVPARAKNAVPLPLLCPSCASPCPPVPVALPGHSMLCPYRAPPCLRRPSGAGHGSDLCFAHRPPRSISGPLELTS